MLRFHWGRSFRGKFFRTVLGGVVLPMVLVALWLYSTVGQSAETLLRAQLDKALERVAVRAASRWAEMRGHADARALLDSLINVGPSDAIDLRLGAIDRTTGAMLGRVPVEPAMLTGDGFDLDGERWLVRRASLADPAITLVAMAPLRAYIIPFERAARKDSLTILLVAGAALGLAMLLTRRMAKAMEDLAIATDAVAAGDLDRRVSEERKDELGRIGRAFNAMTESLRATLQQLSQREALVAVGEFAASLAHEVRNPLTSIRIDLQRVDEKLSPDSPLRVQLGRALREVHRLDQTVTGALRIARSGAITLDLIDLRVPLQRAIDVAASEFESSGGVLTEVAIGTVPLSVRGDEAALEQLFLNILLNAAQAVGDGDEAGVTASIDDGNAVVEIWDAGGGIANDRLAKVFDPFFSTKKDGTGLGLAVSRQIATAHRGTITIDSPTNSGTTVVFRMPLARRPN